jgi:2-keto-myo-inositol isomerase
MQLAFHGATTIKASLEADIRNAQQAGYSALEIWTEKLDEYLEKHTPADLEALFELHQIKPMTLNSIEAIGFRGTEFPSLLERCEELCQIATVIGSPAIAVIPSSKPELQTSWKDIVDEHVRVLRELSSVAKPYGVKLAFEFLGSSWYSVRTPRGAQEIIERAGCDNVGMVFDIAHFAIGGGRLEEIEALDPSMIYGFHVDDVEDTPREAYVDSMRVLPGHGIAPIFEICSRLKAIGYDGPCAIELFRPDLWERDPLEVARLARAAALAVLEPHFQIT